MPTMLKCARLLPDGNALRGLGRRPRGADRARRDRGTFARAADVALRGPRAFEEKSGAFVTINTHPAGELRGCIGYPQPFFPLAKSVEKAAEAAATDDPRFPPMRPEELDAVTVEVSILTPPRLIEVKKPKELPAHVTIGVDGLSVAQGPYRGLLLPQVAVEENFDAADFLSQACMKAGLLPDAWLEPATRVYTFQAEVFTEIGRAHD